MLVVVAPRVTNKLCSAFVCSLNASVRRRLSHDDDAVSIGRRPDERDDSRVPRCELHRRRAVSGGHRCQHERSDRGSISRRRLRISNAHQLTNRFWRASSFIKDLSGESGVAALCRSLVCDDNGGRQRQDVPAIQHGCVLLSI